MTKRVLQFRPHCNNPHCPYHLAFGGHRIQVYTVFDSACVQQIMQIVYQFPLRHAGTIMQIRDWLNFGECKFDCEIVDFDSEMAIFDDDHVDLLLQEMLDQQQDYYGEM